MNQFRRLLLYVNHILKTIFVITQNIVDQRDYIWSFNLISVKNIQNCRFPVSCNECKFLVRNVSFKFNILITINVKVYFKMSLRPLKELFRTNILTRTNVNALSSIHIIAIYVNVFISKCRCMPGTGILIGKNVAVRPKGNI